MKLELHLDWKRTVKTIMTMRGLSNSDLAQAAGTTDATMRQVINKSVKGAVMNKVSEYGFAADWRTLNRTVNPVALGIIAQAVGFGGIGIYWHPKAAMCHADTRAGKATWLCTSPGVYPSTTYNAFILPTIRQGSTGAANRSAIILLQKLLKLKEDGNFGPATTQALIYAQKQHGLTTDGVCGPASWKALSGADKYLKKL